MPAINVEQLYQQNIKPMPVAEQLQLIALMSQRLAIHSESIESKKRSLLELEGLGAEIGRKKLMSKNMLISYVRNGRGTGD